jgi:multiple sugar transport system substrate-binding protein
MMKLALTTAASLALLTGVAQAQTCNDADRVPITWSTIAGFYTDAMSALVKGFEGAYCAKVTVVNIDNSQLYNKQVIEMVGQTGAYDVVSLETAEKAEFAENGFILPMTDYFKDKPQVLDDVPTALRNMTITYKGQVWGLPYYTYSAGLFYRADLLDDEGEKAAFKAKYGYDLAVPKTWEQHRDIAEFFTRKSGAKLKGEALQKDFYGIGLMAGPYPEIQDELSAPIWGMGSDWLTDEGKIPVDDVEKVLNQYLELLKFAPPAALTVTYDGVMNQMKDGQIAMTHGFFLDQWPNAAQTETLVPGAKMGVVEAPGGKAYIGGFLLAVSASSRQPEMAKNFVAYIGGHDAQKAFAEAGGTSTLLSVLNDPDFAKPEMRSRTGHFAVLLDILNKAKDFRSNLFLTPFGAKIYNTMQIPLQAAAAGQINSRQAAEQLAADVEKICGGPCPINK